MYSLHFTALIGATVATCVSHMAMVSSTFIRGCARRSVTTQPPAQHSSVDATNKHLLTFGLPLMQPNKLFKDTP